MSSVEAWSVALGSVVMALSLAACEAPTDWCAEDEDPDTVPASGSFDVDYQGIYGRGPVNIEPFVKSDARGIVIAQGCGTDRDGNLWRVPGAWAVTDGQSLPMEFDETEAPDTRIFSGELFICKDGECDAGFYRIMYGPFLHARGTVSALEVQTGLFTGDVRVPNDLDAEVSMTVDLQWTPRAE